MPESGAKLSRCAGEGAVGSGTPQQDLGFRSVRAGCADLGVLCEAAKAALGLGLGWGDVGDLLVSHVCINFLGLPNRVPQTG